MTKIILINRFYCLNLSVVFKYTFLFNKTKGWAVNSLNCNNFSVVPSIINEKAKKRDVPLSFNLGGATEKG